MYLHPSDKDINQLKAFLKLARSAIKMADLWRGSVVPDMPADSKGWREPSLINFQSKHNLWCVMIGVVMMPGIKRVFCSLVPGKS